jgi:leucyl-tRNA synthetase
LSKLYDISPEHELVAQLPQTKKEAVQAYIENIQTIGRERMADVKTISGVFTGAYAEHPFTKDIPVWIGDCVCRYGTGAVMAVRGDERDYAFTNFFKDQKECLLSKHFDKDILEAAYGAKEGSLVDSF